MSSSSETAKKRWSDAELSKFYQAFHLHGAVWDKVSKDVGKPVEQCELLYSQHKTFLSLPSQPQLEIAFIAMVTDHYLNKLKEEPSEGPGASGSNGDGSDQKLTSAAAGTMETTAGALHADDMAAEGPGALEVNGDADDSTDPGTSHANGRSRRTAPGRRGVSPDTDVDPAASAAAGGAAAAGPGRVKGSTPVKTFASPSSSKGGRGSRGPAAMEVDGGSARKRRGRKLFDVEGGGEGSEEEDGHGTDAGPGPSSVVQRWKEKHGREDMAGVDALLQLASSLDPSSLAPAAAEGDEGADGGDGDEAMARDGRRGGGVSGRGAQRASGDGGVVGSPLRGALGTPSKRGRQVAAQHQARSSPRGARHGGRAAAGRNGRARGRGGRRQQHSSDEDAYEDEEEAEAMMEEEGASDDGDAGTGAATGRRGRRGAAGDTAAAAAAAAAVAAGLVGNGLGQFVADPGVPLAVAPVRTTSMAEPARSILGKRSTPDAGGIDSAHFLFDPATLAAMTLSPLAGMSMGMGMNPLAFAGIDPMTAAMNPLTMNALGQLGAMAVPGIGTMPMAGAGALGFGGVPGAAGFGMLAPPAATAGPPPPVSARLAASRNAAAAAPAGVDAAAVAAAAAAAANGLLGTVSGDLMGVGTRSRASRRKPVHERPPAPLSSLIRSMFGGGASSGSARSGGGAGVAGGTSALQALGLLAPARLGANGSLPATPAAAGGEEGAGAAALRHALGSAKLRRWIMYEFHYSALDRPFFMRSEMAELLHAVGLGSVSRLTRGEWSVLRTAWGRPRRLSLAFLKEERTKLEAYREHVRRVYEEGGPGAEVPAELPRPLRVGQAVTARHPVTRQLHDGTILTTTKGSSKYRVQFNRPELMCELVRDVDIMPVEPGENLPASMSGLSIMLNGRMAGPAAGSGRRGRQSGRGPSGHRPGGPLTPQAGVAPSGAGGLMAGLGPFAPPNPEADSALLDEVAAVVDVKDSLVARLKAMNTEADAGMHTDETGRQAEAFQLQYTQVVLQLKEVNQQLEAMLQRLSHRQLAALSAQHAAMSAAAAAAAGGPPSAGGAQGMSGATTAAGAAPGTPSSGIPAAASQQQQQQTVVAAERARSSGGGGAAPMEQDAAAAAGQGAAAGRSSGGGAAPSPLTAAAAGFGSPLEAAANPAALVEAAMAEARLVVQRCRAARAAAAAAGGSARAAAAGEAAEGGSHPFDPSAAPQQQRPAPMSPDAPPTPAARHQQQLDRAIAGCIGLLFTVQKCTGPEPVPAATMESALDAAVKALAPTGQAAAAAHEQILDSVRALKAQLGRAF